MLLHLRFRIHHFEDSKEMILHLRLRILDSEAPKEMILHLSPLVLSAASFDYWFGSFYFGLAARERSQSLRSIVAWRSNDRHRRVVVGAVSVVFVGIDARSIAERFVNDAG